MKRILTGMLATVMLFLLVSCGVKPEDDRVVVTLDGEKIYYDYFRYVFLNNRDDMDLGDRSYWNDNITAQLELADCTMEVLLRNKAILKLAEKYDIRLTSDQKKEIDNYVEEAKKSYENEAAFKASLAASYLTEYSLRYIQEVMQIWSDLYAYVTAESSGIIQYSDEMLLADISVNFRRIRYVMIYNDETDDAGENGALAETVHQLALNGDDFDELIREYGEDDTMEAKLEEGYYYTLGAIVEEMQGAVEELEENEISEVIDMGYGYFIVQRLPIDSEYAEKNLDEFRESYLARLFNDMVDEQMAKIEVKYEDLYSELSVFTVE